MMREQEALWTEEANRMHASTEQGSVYLRFRRHSLSSILPFYLL